MSWSSLDGPSPALPRCDHVCRNCGNAVLSLRDRISPLRPRFLCVGRHSRLWHGRWKANLSHLAFFCDVTSLFLDLEFCPVGSPDQISGHPVGSETPFLQTGELIAQQCFDVDTVVHPLSLEFRTRGAQR